MVKYAAIKRWPVWIACLAVLLNAFAPSVSHAVAAFQDPLPGAAICRADGGRDGAGKAPLHSAGDAHCAYCLAHAGSIALPPASAAMPAPAPAHRSRLFFSYRRPRPLPAWPDARPRAPPLPARQLALAVPGGVPPPG